MLLNKALRSTLGWLYIWKLVILIGILLLSVFIYRPFCKYICPLGGIYSVFNKVSIFRYYVDKHKCMDCGACANVCDMGCNPVKDANSLECIRCGKCKQICPTNAISCQVCDKKVQ